jgi:hypothetical protein
MENLGSMDSTTKSIYVYIVYKNFVIDKHITVDLSTF